MLSQGFCIRLSTDDDAPAICSLMQKAFDWGDGSNKALNLDWWKWKYVGNPEGRYSIVCEGPDGRLLGHYGGVPSRVLSDGRELTFGQNCDSCTDPEIRRGLRNPGLFVRLAQAYASTFSGYENNALMYGLPIRNAHRIGARYLDYWMLRSQLGLVLDEPSALPALDPQLEVVPVAAVDDALDAFLREHRGALRCHAVRSREFLTWRFLDHPSVDYRLAVVRDVGAGGGGGVRGYAVYRRATFLGREFGLLMDVFVAPADHAALACLVGWAAGRSEADAMSALYFLTSPSLPWWRLLQEWGFRAHTTEYVLAARPYAVIDAAYLREHWTYTFADFDIL